MRTVKLEILLILRNLTGLMFGVGVGSMYILNRSSVLYAYVTSIVDNPANRSIWLPQDAVWAVGC